MVDLDLARCHDAYARLATRYNQGKLPHAFLFTGLTGVGKKAAATQLAMAFHCHEVRNNPAPGDPIPGPSAGSLPLEACGSCPPCRQIVAGQHPDTIFITPSGKSSNTNPVIRIGQIRDLIGTLALKPYGDSLRVVIIEEAQTLNNSAANALLKVLEEPPARTLLILTAGQAESLLSTIRSRCQEIRLAPLSETYVRERLTAEEGLTAVAAGVVAQLAQGSYARAKAMAQPEWMQRRKWIVARITELAELPVAGKLLLAETLVRDKFLLEQFFHCTRSWLRDLAVVQTGAARALTKVMNPDFADLLGQQAGVCSPGDLMRRLAALDQARQALRRTNPNRRLLVEALCLNW